MAVYPEGGYGDSARSNIAPWFCARQVPEKVGSARCDYQWEGRDRFFSLIPALRVRGLDSRRSTCHPFPAPNFRAPARIRSFVKICLLTDPFGFCSGSTVSAMSRRKTSACSSSKVKGLSRSDTARLRLRKTVIRVWIWALTGYQPRERFERNPRQECCMLSCSYRAAAFARKRLL